MCVFFGHILFFQVVVIGLPAGSGISLAHAPGDAGQLVAQACGFLDHYPVAEAEQPPHQGPGVRHGGRQVQAPRRLPTAPGPRSAVSRTDAPLRACEHRAQGDRRARDHPELSVRDVGVDVEPGFAARHFVQHLGALQLPSMGWRSPARPSLAARLATATQQPWGPAVSLDRPQRGTACTRAGMAAATVTEGPSSEPLDEVLRLAFDRTPCCFRMKPNRSTRTQDWMRLYAANRQRPTSPWRLAPFGASCCVCTVSKRYLHLAPVRFA